MNDYSRKAENADPNAEMIVREMFSTILKQVASDNTKNLTVATQIDYYAIVMRNIAKAISEKNGLMSTAKVPLSFLRIAILVKFKKPPCGGLFLIS
jgi:hypothetical protein